MGAPNTIWLASRRALLNEPTATDPHSAVRRVTPALIEVHGATIASAVRLSDVELTQRIRELSAQGASVFDFGERPLTPAFVNAHTHLAMAAMRAIPVLDARGGDMVRSLFFALERRLSPGDVRAFARMGAYESLLCGVALVWDHYYHADAIAASLVDAGLCGVVAATLQDLEGPGVGRAAESIDATLAVARSSEFAARGVFAALGPHATDTVSSALWATVVDCAEREGLPVHLHLAQTETEVQSVYAREQCLPVDMLARVGLFQRTPHVVAAHGIYCTERELSALARARATLVFCPASQMMFNMPANTELWERHGVRWAVATDCAASNDSMNLQKELRTTAGLWSAGIAHAPAIDDFRRTADVAALRALEEQRARASRDALDNARPGRLLHRVWELPGAMHPAFRVGMLHPGALANLIVWDHEHPAFWPGIDIERTLAMSDTTAAMHTLMSAGRFVGRVGDVAAAVRESVEYRDAHREATARLAQLGLTSAQR